ncbi:MAG TPA: ribosomal protein S18-alanine N-acetyltransferase [Reyranella sp.]|nr:ribosomal protein S18-alanine N-acetyltransferase [Reyranella sp.]
MSALFAFRPFGAPDLDLAARFHREGIAVMGERAWTRQDMAELLVSPGVFGLFLRSDGMDIGFALCRVAADEAELLTIAVSADHRRRGAGRALLGEIIAASCTRGAATLFLEVAADNPAAQALYAQAGFKEVGRRRGYYMRGAYLAVDAVVLRLALK